MLKFVLIAFLQCTVTMVFSQSEIMLIGRTTGELDLGNKQTVRVFGFTNSLSGAISLPGTSINLTVCDSVNVDFWNISQGQNHAFFIKGIPLTKELKTQAKTEGIAHMEHGFYQFNAAVPGTYIYYCPLEFPFNLQAGMFGIINLKEPSDSSKLEEVLWCSYEIDTAWHNAALLDFEYTTRFDQKEIPPYNPSYFLINGWANQKLKKERLTLSLKERPRLKITLVNTGQYNHQITFPPEVGIEVLRFSNKELNYLNENNCIHLPPMETCELILTAQKKIKTFIKYQFIDPNQRQFPFTQQIPIIIKN